MAPAIRSFDESVGEFTLRMWTIRSENPSAGARPTLVFLHDSLGCITVWRDFPTRLAAALGCHALVYDRRGYGASSPFGPEPRTLEYLDDEADVLHRVLDASGVSRAVLFGHSDGGSIALIAAARDDGRIQAVVSEGAHVFVEDITLEGIRTARDLLRTTDMRERLYRHHGERTDGVTSAWIDTWLSPAFRTWNIELLLPRITCPVLVLQGEHDEYGTAEQTRAIAAGVRGPAEVILLANAGHSPHRDDAEAVIRATQRFLEKAESLNPKA